MADDTHTPAAPLQLIEAEADGYCDPVTGVCALPGAAAPSAPSPPDTDIATASPT